jgi:hypothetical protein
MNPLERLWRYLKEQVCINKFHPHMSVPVQAVIDQLERQND